MKKVILYIAASMNGKIATADGSVDWLEAMPIPKDSDYGYGDLQARIDTTIQGFNTFNQINSRGIPCPYPNTQNYVFTSRTKTEDTEDYHFITEHHLDFIRDLKKQSGKDIWLIGGGITNTILFNSNLIDEIHLYLMPIVLSDGIEVFEHLPNQTQLKLIDSKSFSTGVVEMRYRV